MYEKKIIAKSQTRVHIINSKKKTTQSINSLLRDTPFKMVVATFRGKSLV